MKIVIALIGFIWLCLSCKDTKLIIDEEFTLQMERIVKTVEENHVDPKAVDDNLSEGMFEYFLEEIDAQQLLFTQAEIAKLSKYKFKIDDDLINKDHNFLVEAMVLYSTCLKRAEKLKNIVLNEKIELEKEERLNIAFSIDAFMKDEKALKNRWRKIYKKYLLEAKTLIDSQTEFESSISMQNIKMPKHLAAILLDKTFTRYAEKSNQDLKEDFIFSYLQQHDLQSDFMTAEEKEAWDSNMTRELKGIGVFYTFGENLYPIITEVLYGGPAWNSGKVDIGDVILKVGDEPNLLQDLVGYSGREFQDLLLGDIGSNVTIQVKKKNNQIENIRLTRDKVVLPLAYSFVLSEEGRDQRVGYINLPRFYSGDEGSAYHILVHLRKMKENDISSLIVDLRDNKGGSSSEARMISSYFLDEGPVMQRLLNSGEIIIETDQDGKAEYTGDLLVLCNGRSSSASELFAGNMKDYNRGLIVGSPTTFGKGSAQRFFPLNVDSNEEGEDFGILKLTYARFFTASGKSSQIVGIPSDIVLPDEYLYIKSGEREYDNAIKPLFLDLNTVSQQVNNVQDKNALLAKSNARVMNNIQFQAAYAYAECQKALESDTVLLGLDGYRQKVELLEMQDRGRRKLFSVDQKIEIESLFKIGSKKEAYDNYLKSKLKKDPYILESIRILEDMLVLTE